MKYVYTLLSIIFLSMCISCSGDSDDKKLKGQVVDLMTDEPIKDAIVTVVPGNIKRNDIDYKGQIVKTNEYGYFQLKDFQRVSTFVVTKEGYSIDKKFLESSIVNNTSGQIHFTPISVLQTKFVNYPFHITRVPEDKGVFVYSDGKFKKINQIKLEKDQFKQNTEHLAKRTFYYIENPEEEIFNKAKEAIFINLHGDNDEEYFIKRFSFFDEIKSCTEYSYAGEASWELMDQKNIFVEGVGRSDEDDNIIGFFARWEAGSDYEDPYDYGMQGYGELPSKKIYTPGGYLTIFFIQDLPNGYYTISPGKSRYQINRDDNGIRWAFEKI